MTRGRSTTRLRLPDIDPDQAALRFAAICASHWRQLAALLRPVRIGERLDQREAERTAIFRNALLLSEYAVLGRRPRQPLGAALATLDPLASSPFLENSASNIAKTIDLQIETDAFRLIMAAALAREQLATAKVVTSAQVAVLAGVSGTGLRAAIARGELASQDRSPGAGGVYTVRSAEAERWLIKRGVRGFGTEPPAVKTARGRPTTRPRVPSLDPHHEALRLTERAFAQWLSLTAMIHPAGEPKHDDELRRSLVYRKMLQLAHYAVHGTPTEGSVGVWFASLGSLASSPLGGSIEFTQIVSTTDLLERDEEVELLLAAAFAREQITAGKPVSTTEVAVLAGVSRQAPWAAIERGELVARDTSPGTGNSYAIPATRASIWLAERGVPGFIKERPRRARKSLAD